MARADSAHAPMRAGAARGLACTAAQPASLRLAQREIWVRRAVPAMVALFAGTLVAVTVVVTHEAHDRAVTDAFTDIELTAGIVTGNLNGAFRDSLKTDPAAALARAAPSRALARGQQL
ncbi:MAG: PAS domain-containing sensor histidine kinase, partial [Methylocella sp.]